MAEMEQYPQEWRDYEPIQPRGGIDWRALFRKLWAPIAAPGLNREMTPLSPASC